MASYSPFQCSGACALAIGLSIIVVACQAQDRTAQPPAPSTSSKIVCGAQLKTVRSDDPQAVFRRYAEAVNSMDWCSAISAFAPAARTELALVTFKGFVLMAGSENPKRSSYAQEFEDFCKEHQFDYASSSRLAGLTAQLMSRDSVDDQLSDLKRVASAKPDDLYAEIMTRLQRVDQESLAKFDPVLNEVSVAGDRATGVARQRDGRTSRMSFAQSREGWFATTN